MRKHGVRLAILVMLVGASAGRASASPAPAAVEAGASPPITPLTGAPPGSPAVPVRYVGSLRGLEASMQSDSLLHARVQSIADRRTAGFAVLFGGMAVGAALSIGSMTFLAGQDCTDFAGRPSCMPSPNGAALAGGMLVTAASVLAGFAIAPRSGEIVDLVNDWNARHPDQPYAFIPGSELPSHHHRH